MWTRVVLADSRSFRCRPNRKPNARRVSSINLTWMAERSPLTKLDLCQAAVTAKPHTTVEPYKIAGWPERHVPKCSGLSVNYKTPRLIVRPARLETNACLIPSFEEGLAAPPNDCNATEIAARPGEVAPHSNRDNFQSVPASDKRCGFLNSLWSASVRLRGRTSPGRAAISVAR
jgi:hypothetical protein